MDTSNQHTKTTKDEEVFCISVYLPNEKRSSKDLNTTIQLKNKGQSIKVTSIPWFFIVNFDFGYVFITNYRLKAYVYILEIVFVIFWLLFARNVYLWIFDTEQLDEMHIVLASLDRLTTTSPTPH